MPMLQIQGLPEFVVIGLSILTWSILGAAAAFIFTVIAANTDRADKVRLSGLSLLAGMFWLPVISGAKSYVDNQEKANEKQEVVAALEQVDKLREEVSDLDGAKKQEVLAKIDAELKRASDIASRLDSAELLSEVTARSTGRSQGLSIDVAPGLPAGSRFELANLPDLPRAAIPVSAQVLPAPQLILNLCDPQSTVQTCIEQFEVKPPVASNDLDRGKEKDG